VLQENMGKLMGQIARLPVRMVALVMNDESPVSAESPALRFFQAHSLTESMVMCSIGTSYQSASSIDLTTRAKLLIEIATRGLTPF
jgi:hypothetical protein